jgi:glucose/arabinose dehydrogenase
MPVQNVCVRLGCSVAISVLAALPVGAQMPDCTGISDVSGYDGSNVSDFDGQLTSVLMATGFTQPTQVISPPDGPDGPDDRLFIVEQPGRIRILDLATRVLNPTPFLQIEDRVQIGGFFNTEEGLLSMAFHPDYNTPGAANEGHFFVFYTNDSGNNQISRFAVAAPGDADEDSEQTVLEVAHPGQANHNGGQLAFGPDGRLYASFGDGGGSCDTTGSSQNPLELRGTIVRLDVGMLPYSTDGNPFDGMDGAEEVWAWGLRNTWRFSFDRLTGALYGADVGQAEWEEIDCQPPTSDGGENYGWVYFEGYACPNPSCGGIPQVCGTIDHTPPIRVYSHSRDGFSCSITGGFVYRGCRMSDLHGTYFYADFCSNAIYSFRTDATCPTVTDADEISRAADLDPPDATALVGISAFGEDSRGELYVVNRTQGQVFKVLPILPITEVSGDGAPLFEFDGDDWVWEDLGASSGHRINTYRVYRSVNDAAGPFTCVSQSSGTSWVGGDPEIPGPDEDFFYLVTALDDQRDEAAGGYLSDGTPRNVDTSSVCP